MLSSRSAQKYQTKRTRSWSNPTSKTLPNVLFLLGVVSGILYLKLNMELFWTLEQITTTELVMMVLLQTFRCEMNHSYRFTAMNGSSVRLSILSDVVPLNWFLLCFLNMDTSSAKIFSNWTFTFTFYLCCRCCHKSVAVFRSLTCSSFLFQCEHVCFQLYLFKVGAKSSVAFVCALK